MEDKNNESEEDWTLSDLKKTDYLPKRPKFFADNVFPIGAAVAAILMIVAMLSR
jgi:hypothetical protein